MRRRGPRGSLRLLIPAPREIIMKRPGGHDPLEDLQAGMQAVPAAMGPT